LLLSGSLDTLQSASIAAAFPFTIIMIIMCYSLYKGLKEEKKESNPQVKAPTENANESKEAI
jgi:glycine betaine transporter